MKTLLLLLVLSLLTSKALAAEQYVCVFQHGVVTELNVKANDAAFDAHRNVVEDPPLTSVFTVKSDSTGTVDDPRDPIPPDPVLVIRGGNRVLSFLEITGARNVNTTTIFLQAGLAKTGMLMAVQSRHVMLKNSAAVSQYKAACTRLETTR